MSPGEVDRSGLDDAVPPRVVSLVPSVTETLLAWGIVPAGVTRFCEQPELRQVGGTKDPDLDAIVALRPDVVVMCVEENRREDAAALAARGVPVHAVDIDSVDDVEPQLAALALAVGVAPVTATRIGAGRVAHRRRAFVPIWRRPWMTLSDGCYGASLLARLGVDNVFGDAGDRYPEIDLADAAERRPDLVIAPSEPYPFGPRHVRELEEVAPVVLVDGQDLFWWGVRTPAALSRLAGQLASVA